MPLPVSRTLMTAAGLDSVASASVRSSSAERTSVSRPPCGIASTALIARFMMTCSNWPASHRTSNGSAAR